MSKISEKVKEYLSSAERMNVLSTSNKSGENNVAIFGSVRLADDNTIMMMLGNNKTFSNLQENPHAALLVVMPGKSGLETEGCRVYLKLRKVEDGGEIFDRMKAEIKAKIGDAAEILQHLVIFDIVGVRPIVDMGQDI